jgi:hypothetical protein
MRTILALMLFTLVACSGEGAAGDPCDHSGVEEGECEPGTICGKIDDKSDALECLFICKDDKDCPGGKACKGVAGADTKGCRLP